MRVAPAGGGLCGPRRIGRFQPLFDPFELTNESTQKKMDLPFFSTEDDVDSDDLEKKLQTKREELADVRQKHERAREVAEEREQVLKELQARKEIGADVDTPIQEVKEELEQAKEEREGLRERLDALQEAIPILEDRLEEARQEEVQAEYDQLVSEIESKSKRVASLLAEAAELSAETRELCIQGSRLANEFGAEDHAGLYNGARAGDFWAIYSGVDIGDYVSNEPLTLSRVRRGSSRLENWLGTLESQVEEVERPDVPEQMSTATPFDE